MTTPCEAAWRDCRIDDLEIDDRPSFRHVALYGDLEQVLRLSGFRFRVLPETTAGRWDRTLLLNLTFWQAGAGGDVLGDRRVNADVVAHAAWHHLAAVALADPAGRAPSPAALFLGESIASAFDLYLVGRLLGHAPSSSFLETQVPAMADAAAATGLDADGFEALLHDVAGDPERAFADLRSLLVAAAASLFACDDAREGLAALVALDAHRFAPLLPHYELSNWVLHARAFARRDDAADVRAAAVEKALVEAPCALGWLERTWVAPSLGAAR